MQLLVFQMMALRKYAPFRFGAPTVGVPNTDFSLRTSLRE